jgi:hypothetical protein
MAVAAGLVILAAVIGSQVFLWWCRRGGGGFRRICHHESTALHAECTTRQAGTADELEALIRRLQRRASAARVDYAQTYSPVVGSRQHRYLRGGCDVRSVYVRLRRADESLRELSRSRRCEPGSRLPNEQRREGMGLQVQRIAGAVKIAPPAISSDPAWQPEPLGDLQPPRLALGLTTGF